MATVTTGSVVASAEAQITAITSQLSTVQAAAASKLTELVASLQAHAAAHQAEVDAAQALIAKASPGTTGKAAEAAAFVLTGGTQVQGLVNFFGKNWRYLVIALGLGVVAYAKFGLGLL